MQKYLKLFSIPSVIAGCFNYTNQLISQKYILNHHVMLGGPEMFTTRNQWMLTVCLCLSVCINHTSTHTHKYQNIQYVLKLLCKLIYYHICTKQFLVISRVNEYKETRLY
jgi:hypothetical protein